MTRPLLLYLYYRLVYLYYVIRVDILAVYLLILLIFFTELLVGIWSPAAFLVGINAYILTRLLARMFNL